MSWNDKTILTRPTMKDMEVAAGETLYMEISCSLHAYNGKLTITRLRLLWEGAGGGNQPKISIGWGAVSDIHCKERASKLRGSQQGIVIKTFMEDEGVTEFSFYSQKRGLPSGIFNSLPTILRQYRLDGVFREPKFGASISNNLQLLSGEKIYSETPGVINVSGDEGVVGKFIVTNIRTVWHSLIDPKSNVSVPHIVTDKIALKSGSKYAENVLVIEFNDKPLKGRKIILGFKIEPPTLLSNVEQELSRVSQLFKANPILGAMIDLKQDTPAEPRSYNKGAGTMAEDDHEVMDTLAVKSFNSSGRAHVTEKEYCPELGLMIKKLPPGVTYKSLWQIV